MLFQNCARQPDTFGQSSEQEYSLPEINYFKETRPTLICGKDGWAFMQRNYISTNCSGCHYQGAPNRTQFAGLDLDNAFTNAKSVSKDSWHKFTTQNAFCYPNCDLNQNGDVYKGLMEWADHKDCP